MELEPRGEFFVTPLGFTKCRENEREGESMLHVAVEAEAVDRPGLCFLEELAQRTEAVNLIEPSRRCPYCRRCRPLDGARWRARSKLSATDCSAALESAELEALSCFFGRPVERVDA